MRTNPKRATHYLRPNHGTEIPRNLIFVETISQAAAADRERDSELHRLDFGVADGIRLEGEGESRWSRLTFQEPLPFWAWFNSRVRKKSGMWLIGHGIAKSFTLLDGWRQIDQGHFRLTPRKTDTISQNKDDLREMESGQGWLVDNDPPTIILLYGDGFVCHVVDVQNYGLATIEELADAVEVKLPPKPSEGAPFKAWEEWLTKRMYACRQYITRLCRWWKANDMGQWRHTAASLAMAAFRHKFLAQKILIHTCDEALRAEREALVGGQFSTFYCGPIGIPFGKESHGRRSKIKRQENVKLGPIHVFDCNSLYPYVMREHDYPRELVAPKMDGTFDDLLHWRKQLLLIARVKVETVQHPFPFVYDKERLWCVGSFWTVLCGPELNRAIDDGHIKAVGEIYAYFPGRLFKGYVDYFHGLRMHYRENGKLAPERFAKLCMNSLAGKFGQRNGQWEFTKHGSEHPRWGLWTEVNAQTGEIRNFRAVAGDVQINSLGTESLQSAPAIEAFINAHAREYMRKVRRKLPSGSCLYQGCDSLHVLPAGLPAMKAFQETYPGELGKFKLEGIYATAEYRGPQDYTLDGQHVTAGVAPGLPMDKDGKFTMVETQGLKSILTHEPGGFLRVKKVKISAQGYHPKGILNPDGSVSPPQVIGGEVHLDRSHPKAYPFDPDGIGK